MVTAELAVAVPTLIVVTVLATGAISVASAQLRCVDAAAVAARLAARGDNATVTAGAVASVAPPGSTLRLTRRDGLVVADVAATVHAPGTGRLLPGFVVHARAVAADESTP
jgi:hypothetical protein